MNYCILRDKRVQGYSTRLTGALYTVEVDGNISLKTAFLRIKAQAKLHGKLDMLFIICHGMGTGPTYTELMWRGGLGLELGSENVTLTNVFLWKDIKDLVRTIVVYACGAAYTGPSLMPGGFQGRGQILMSDLSKNTNALVYASDRMQWYIIAGLDFGEWEGTVYMFTPSGFSVAGLAPEVDKVW
jgi:hypothetical protein